jgi:hypothetical protein
MAILRAAVTTSDLRTLIAAVRRSSAAHRRHELSSRSTTGRRPLPFRRADQFDVTEPDSVEALPKSLTDYVRRIGQPRLVNSDDFATPSAGRSTGRHRPVQ